MDLFMADFNLTNTWPDVRIIENKTLAKIKDTDHKPCKAKLEFIIDFILGERTFHLTEIQSHVRILGS